MNSSECETGEAEKSDPPSGVQVVDDGSTAVESGLARIRNAVATRVTNVNAFLVGTIALVVAVRMLPFGDVFQNGAVVLSGNDPYRVRYWVESLAAAASGPFDVSVLSTLPVNVAMTDPLTVLTLAWVTEVLGGSQSAAGVVLALYPVVSAVVTAYLVYRISMALVDDPRVGLAAVCLLAVTPGHAFRTGLGFADHHAFDYPWLALTIFALVVLTTSDPRERRTWGVAGGLGFAVAGQTLAWQASPLLLAPLAVCIAVYGLLVVRNGPESVASLFPIAGGLLLATALTVFVRATFGWPSAPVAYTPGVLLVGCVGVWLAARLTVAGGRSAPTLAGIYVGGLAGVFVLVGSFREVAPVLVSEFFAYIDRGIAYFARFGATGIGETQSLTAQFGPIAGPLIMLGYALFLGLPVTLWAVWRAYDRNEAGWLLVSVYAWYFVAAAMVQRRFTGELAAPLAILAGLGFVYLLSWLALVRPPATAGATDERRGGSGSDVPDREDGDTVALELPGRRQFVTLAGLSFVIGSFPTLFTAYIHEDLTIDEPMYRSAEWMRGYADDRDWQYPRNYVFSAWGRNRMFNYVVNGQSRSYWFAQRHFGEFLRAPAQAGEAWYDRLRDRVGFVVTRDELVTSGLSSGTIYTRLHEHFGSGGEGVDGLSHYRAVYASSDSDLTVFTLVPGATLVGTGPAEEVLILTVDVSIPGAEFRYARAVSTDSDGSFSVTVPYPGVYALEDTTVRVTEANVDIGETVRTTS